MAAKKCGCEYADARNTRDVALGREMGGYLLHPCDDHKPVKRAAMDKLPDNPWREFIENVIDGSNYFRASEYRILLADLDRGYAAQEVLAAQSTEIAAAKEQAATLGDGYLDATNRAQVAEEALAAAKADNERLRVAFDVTDERASVTWYGKWVDEKRRADKAEAELARAREALRGIRDSTFRNATTLRGMADRALTALKGEEG